LAFGNQLAGQLAVRKRSKRCDACCSTANGRRSDRCHRSQYHRSIARAANRDDVTNLWIGCGRYGIDAVTGCIDGTHGCGALSTCDSLGTGLRCRNICRNRNTVSCRGGG